MYIYRFKNNYFLYFEKVRSCSLYLCKDWYQNQTKPNNPHRTEVHHKYRILLSLSKWLALNPHPPFCKNIHCCYLLSQKWCQPWCDGIDGIAAFLCLSVSLAQRKSGLNLLGSDGNHVLNFSFLFFVGKNNLNLETKMKTFSVVQEAIVWCFPVTLHHPLWVKTIPTCPHSAPALSGQHHILRNSNCFLLQMYERESQQIIRWHGAVVFVAGFFPPYVYIFIITTTESKMLHITSGLVERRSRSKGFSFFLFFKFKKHWT